MPGRISELPRSRRKRAARRHLRRRARSAGWGRAAPALRWVPFEFTAQPVVRAGGRVRYPARGLRGWSPRGTGEPAGGGRGVLGELVSEMPGVGSRRGCFRKARVALGAGVAVYSHTRVRSPNAFQSHLRSLPPLHFNFLCVPLR